VQIRKCAFAVVLTVEINPIASHHLASLGLWAGPSNQPSKHNYYYYSSHWPKLGAHTFAWAFHIARRLGFGICLVAGCRLGSAFIINHSFDWIAKVRFAGKFRMRANRMPIAFVSFPFICQIVPEMQDHFPYYVAYRFGLFVLVGQQTQTGSYLSSCQFQNHQRKCQPLSIHFGGNHRLDLVILCQRHSKADHQHPQHLPSIYF